MQSSRDHTFASSGRIPLQSTTQTAQRSDNPHSMLQDCDQIPPSPWYLFW